MPYTVHLLKNGSFKLDAGSMFGLIPKTVWQDWLDTDEHNRMTIHQNSLLLEGHGNLVLIEAGIGGKVTDRERRIYALDDTHRPVHKSVRDAGFDPDDVTHVVLTHLHFDHAGGITRWNGDHHDDASHSTTLAFPNATIIVQEREWKDAVANKSTMTKTYLKDHLTPEVAEKLQLVPEDGEDEVEVLPDLCVFRTPGHTWGQQSIRFQVNDTGPSVPPNLAGRTVSFVADVMPTRWHARPTTNLAYDVEPYTSMLARSALVDRARSERWVVMPNHDPADHPFYEVGIDPENPKRWSLHPVA